MLGLLCGSRYDEFASHWGWLVGDISTIALIFIMFYGGFGTRWKSARPVAVEAGLLATAGVALTAVFVGLFCHLALGQTVYSWGLKYESPTFIAVINLGEPVFGALLALVLLSEIPAPFVIAGSVIVLGGMYLFSIHTEGER